jgi:hypothetical protein
MVQTAGADCVTEIEEMYRKSKSTLSVVDNVEQSIGSFPVSVNSMADEVEVAAVAANVKVGGVVSGVAPGVYRTMTTPSPPLATLLPVVGAPAPPPVLSTPLLALTADVDEPFPPPC